MTGPTSVQQVRAAAERLLAYRSRSRWELLERLRRRFPEELVLPVLDHLETLGLVNDQSFAQQWVERSASRPRGRGLLVRELVSKGISREEAQALTAEMDEEEAALAAARKAARRAAGLPYADFQRRVGQHLQRRGFPAGLIRRVVAAVWREPSLDTPYPTR